MGASPTDAPSPLVRSLTLVNSQLIPALSIPNTWTFFACEDRRSRVCAHPLRDGAGLSCICLKIGEALFYLL